MPFHYAGIAKEFPTAPLDSFLVANAGYLARQTDSRDVGSFLIQTDGTDPTTVATRVHSMVGPGAKVTDIASSRQVIGTSLTAVELSGLTKVELAFGLILAAASTGLVLGLGFSERRRSFAIAAALGARTRQLGAFAWSEATVVTAGRTRRRRRDRRRALDRPRQGPDGGVRPAAGHPRGPLGDISPPWPRSRSARSSSSPG